MYDLAILGGGPAGYLAAERAGEAGLKAVVIEKNNVGGVCLNEGCIPSKALLYSAKLYDGAAHGEKYGVKVEKISLDHKTVINRKKNVVNALVGGIKAKLKKLGVEIVPHEGVISGRTAEGFNILAGGKTYTGKQLLIATGSAPVVPPIDGLKAGIDSGFVLTNREILDLESVPENLVVIGGGVIGLEMASYYNTAGSKVTVIEMLDHIAGFTDSDIAAILQKNYAAKGINFLLSSKVTKFTSNSVEYEKDGKTESVKADKVLLSIGRRPSTAGIGLESIGVYTERGAIKTDDRCRTNVAGVYAAGDVNGHSMLAHTAYREAEVSINDILGIKDTMSYLAIPAVIYTNPEVASVGYTEAEAKAKGLNVKTTKLTMKYSGRYVAENEGGDGIIKLVVDAEKQTIIGVSMIGSYSSEIILSAVLMVEMKMRIADIKKAVFPHPSVAEIIREAIFETHI